MERVMHRLGYLYIYSQCILPVFRYCALLLLLASCPMYAGKISSECNSLTAYMFSRLRTCTSVRQRKRICIYYLKKMRARHGLSVYDGKLLYKKMDRAVGRTTSRPGDRYCPTYVYLNTKFMRPGNPYYDIVLIFTLFHELGHCRQHAFRKKEWQSSALDAVSLYDHAGGSIVAHHETTPILHTRALWIGSCPSEDDADLSAIEHIDAPYLMMRWLRSLSIKRANGYMSYQRIARLLYVSCLKQSIRKRLSRKRRLRFASHAF